MAKGNNIERDEFNVNLGRRIQKKRTQAGETQDYLAKEVLGAKTYRKASYIESGERPIDVKTLLLIAEHYNVSTDYLLKGGEPSNNEELMAIYRDIGLTSDVVKTLQRLKADSKKDSNDKKVFSKRGIEYINALLEYFTKETTPYFNIAIYRLDKVWTEYLSIKDMSEEERERVLTEYYELKDALYGALYNIDLKFKAFNYEFFELEELEKLSQSLHK